MLSSLIQVQDETVENMQNDSYKKFVVHCMKDKYDVYIGRWNPKVNEQSIWHNPFKDGTREEKLKQFGEYLLANDELLSKLHTLRGKKLGCWCSPLDCHGDIIAKLANQHEQIIVRNFWEPVPPGYVAINITSTSKEPWLKGFSPFVVGPVEANGQIVTTVENAWQYSKVYPWHLNSDGSIKEEYFRWRDFGYKSPKSDRYPFGKKSKHCFVFWNGDKIESELEAKEKVFLPLYSNAVRKTESYEILLQLSREGMNFCLLDFDAYDHMGKTKKEIIDHPTRKFGHGFCIKWLLDEDLKRDDKNG